MTADATHTNEIKFCNTCVKFKPLTEFRRRRDDKTDRMNKCRECHNAAERERRRKKKKQKRARELNQFAANVAREPNNRRVELLCAAMVTSFGGLQPLIEEWLFHVEQVRIREPGSKKVLDFFRCLTRMSEAAHDRPRLSPKDLSTEDLEFVLRQQIRRLIEDQPELAIPALEELGWELRPPSSIA